MRGVLRCPWRQDGRRRGQPGPSCVLPGGRLACGGVLAPRPSGSGRAQASAPLSPVPSEGEGGARADMPGRAGRWH